MKKKRTRNWFAGLLGIFICLTILGSKAHAKEKKFQWSARISVSQQYDDNIFLDHDNKEDDWLTIVGPGVTLAVLTETTPIRLNYDLGYVYYAQDTRNNDWRHTISLTGLEGVPIADRWTLDFNQYLYISEDPIEEAPGTTSVRRNRSRYYRNIGGGRINYLFGEEDVIYVGFDHTILINDDPEVSDSQRYGPKAGIAYWFNTRNGCSLDFLYERADFDDSPEDEFERYLGNGAYTYRFSPNTEFNLAYAIDSYDYKEDIFEDYVAHSGSLSLGHQFTENTGVSISGGYWVVDLDGKSNLDGPLGTLNFTHTLEKISFALEGSAGYRVQYVEAENLGFSEFYRASAALDWTLLEPLTAALSAFYQTDDYKQTIDDREDDNYGGSASLTYIILPEVSASLSYDYRRRDSNIRLEDFTDNRVTFSIVASYMSKPRSF